MIQLLMFRAECMFTHLAHQSEARTQPALRSQRSQHWTAIGGDRENRHRAGGPDSYCSMLTLSRFDKAMALFNMITPICIQSLYWCYHQRLKQFNIYQEAKLTTQAYPLRFLTPQGYFVSRYRRIETQCWKHTRRHTIWPIPLHSCTHTYMYSAH